MSLHPRIPVTEFEEVARAIRAVLVDQNGAFTSIGGGGGGTDYPDEHEGPPVDAQRVLQVDSAGAAVPVDREAGATARRVVLVDEDGSIFGTGDPMPISDGGGSITIDGSIGLAPGSNTIGKVDQGAAGLTAWKVDGSSVTQPVVITGTPTVDLDPTTVGGSTAKLLDFDTGAGTDDLLTIGIALPAPGGAVIGGTASAPLRVDPIGTTTQPVSVVNSPTVAVSSLPAGTVAGATPVTFDFDLGAGTQNLIAFGIALPADGGAVLGGSDTDPIRIDPTGDTPQPVTGTVTLGGGVATIGKVNQGTAGTDPWVIKVSQAGTDNAVAVVSLPSGSIAATTAPILDYDTGAGTNNVPAFGFLLPASGGAVPGGTGTNPLRIDPTGSTTQPVSVPGTVTVEISGAANDVDVLSLPAATIAGSTPKTADFDTTGATDTVVIFGLALPSATGAVVGGTATNPIRTDPTGSTTQPISGNVGILGTVTTALSQSGANNDVDVVTVPYQLSTNNSTSATLGSGAVFTGTGEEVLAYGTIQVGVYSNVGSATDGLELQFSNDNSTWYTTDSYSYAGGTLRTFSLTPIARYFRVKYTNGVTGQTTFFIQTVYRTAAIKSSSHRLGDTVTHENDAELTKAVCAAEIEGSSSYVSLIADSQGRQVVKFLGQYAEDVASNTGDEGVSILAVRSDTPSTSTSTNGDYTPLKTDSAGRLWVSFGNAPATLADDVALPTAPFVGAVAYEYDGSEANLDLVRHSYFQQTTGITGASDGTTINMTDCPMQFFTMSVIAAGATAFNVDLEGSLDNSNWFVLVNSASATGASTQVYIATRPVRYVRYSVNSVAGGGATLAVRILAMR